MGEGVHVVPDGLSKVSSSSHPICLRSLNLAQVIDYSNGDSEWVTSSAKWLAAQVQGMK